jgi:DNA-directed RNA polymerase subunit F
MIGRRVTKRRVASLAEVEKLLRERGGELGYGQQASLEYAKKFAKVGKETADELIEKLTQNEKISAWTAVKIVDVMPKYKSQITAIAVKEKCDLTEKEKDEVIKIIAEALPKKEEKEEKAEGKVEGKEEG